MLKHAGPAGGLSIFEFRLSTFDATPVQEIAYSMATAIGVLDAVRDSGQVAPERFGRVFGSISFFVNAGIRFVEEICKLRAMTEMWDRIGSERYAVEDPKARRFRYGVQVNSLGLTEAQPENNVQRIVLEMLGVTLSKGARARSIQLPAWNEALGLPRPWDQQWSLRMQQVLAFESDILEYGDIFDGSHVVEARTAELREAAQAELDDVLGLGGVFEAVDVLSRGWSRRWRSAHDGSSPAIWSSSVSTTSSRRRCHRWVATRRSSASIRRSRNKRSPHSPRGAPSATTSPSRTPSTSSDV
jgi:(2R)-ethylmalonyl-CoA mutase